MTNQIKKRLEIIKLAIFMTDAETIKLQLLKLEPFEDDEHINEIITLLRQKKYAQAQVLIDLYNTDEIDYFRSQIESISKESNTTEEIQQPAVSGEPLVDEFNILKNHHTHISPIISDYSNKPYSSSKIGLDLSIEKIDKMPINQSQEHTKIANEQASKTIETSADQIESQNNKQYPPIPDIVDKIQQIAANCLDKEVCVFNRSVNSWIQHIAQIGYTDKGIFNMLAYMQKLKSSKNSDEAAQLAIIFGATNSDFGKLIFARELYRGELFRKNDIKAFELIKELASDNCPEALCDLGQFYEYGVGTKQNIKQAEYCYKLALELDSHRAKNLYHKIRKKKKGFFSFLFRDEDDIL